jgi:hypothetical protein
MRSASLNEHEDVHVDVLVLVAVCVVVADGFLLASTEWFL